jgi:hypothetical protein
LSSPARDNELDQVDQVEKAVEATCLSGRELGDSGLEEPYQPREPLTFNWLDVSSQEFQDKIWPRGCPVLIRGSKIQGNWGPEYWISRYGHIDVTIENCETGETGPSTVAAFLRTYGTVSLENPRAGVWKLKVCIVMCPLGSIIDPILGLAS